MAVLKDLIVHGASRFLGDVYFNFLKADDIAAEAGYFKKLTAIEGTIDDLTSTNLVTKNATVTALLDVQGDMHTNSWSNSNIATIDGSFYITPTSVSTDGSDISASNYTPTCTITYTSPNFTNISITGTFDTSQLVLDSNSHVPWSASSEVIVTGDVLVGNEWLPLGTIRGKLGSEVAATNASKTISIIPLSSTLTDGQGHSSVTLEAIRTGINLTSGTSSSLKMRKVKVSLTSRTNGSNQYPVGILLSAQGTGTGQTFIDIYGGNNLRNGQSGTINGTTKTFTKPVVRIGNLEGLPSLANQTPSGWGIYTSNGFFEGAIVAKEGYIGNTGGYWIIGGGQTSGSTFLRSAPTGPTTVGATSTAGTYLGTDGFLNTASSTTYAQITNGVLTAQGAIISGTIDATSFKARDINQKVRAEVNTNGLLIYDSDGTVSTNGTLLAQFGSTTQIGKSAQAHINITSGGLDLYKGATGFANLITHLGYGSTDDTLGNTTNIPYFTLGTRRKNQAEYATSYIPGIYSVTMGLDNVAQGSYAVAIGETTEAIGHYSYAEGSETYARGDGSHAEGKFSEAQGDYSHAGGHYSKANGNYSFAHGNYTIATADYQAVFGKYNEQDSEAMFIIGNGTSDEARSNLMTVGDNYVRIGNTDASSYMEITPQSVSLISDTKETALQSSTSGITISSFVQIQTLNSTSRVFNLDLSAIENGSAFYMFFSTQYCYTASYASQTADGYVQRQLNSVRDYRHYTTENFIKGESSTQTITVDYVSGLRLLINTNSATSITDTQSVQLNITYDAINSTLTVSGGALTYSIPSTTSTYNGVVVGITDAYSYVYLKNIKGKQSIYMPQTFLGGKLYLGTYDDGDVYDTTDKSIVERLQTLGWDSSCIIDEEV